MTDREILEELERMQYEIAQAIADVKLVMEHEAELTTTAVSNRVTGVKTAATRAGVNPSRWRP